MREYFEATSSYLVEVEPYRLSGQRTGISSNVSSIYLKSGREFSGVDLQWNPKDDFLKLSKEQKDKLMEFLKTD